MVDETSDVELRKTIDDDSTFKSLEDKEEKVIGSENDGVSESSTEEEVRIKGLVGNWLEVVTSRTLDDEESSGLEVSVSGNDV